MPSFITSSTLQRTIHQGHRRLERLGTDGPRAIFHLGQITTIQKTMRYLLSFLLALACLTTSAQQLIFGSVRDGFLKTPLADARVSLLTTDSIVVQDSIKVTLRKRNGERWGTANFVIQLPKKTCTYLLPPTPNTPTSQRMCMEHTKPMHSLATCDRSSGSMTAGLGRQRLTLSTVTQWITLCKPA